MTFSVCIPSIRADTLPSAIRSIQSQRWEDWELIVLGQGDHAEMSTAVDHAARGDGRVRHVHLEGRGLSRARNLATEVAGGDLIAFMDDDCEADPGWLTALAAGFAQQPDIGLVGGAVMPPRSSRRVLGACPSVSPAEALYNPLAHPRQPPAGWDWIGANFAIRAGILARIGRWDECLGAGAAFPAGEDTDYKLRLEANGVSMLTTPRAVVHHSFGVRSGVERFHSQRNYAMGNGATAAKLTLLGDARGSSWLEATRRECTTSWLRSLRPHRLPVDLRRCWYFQAAYTRCLREYELDSQGLLRLREPGSERGIPRRAGSSTAA